MTNQWTERMRPGGAPGRRGSGWRRCAGLLLGLVALLAGGSRAFAAEVVEVRVGRHPDFTRIVFELDRAAGYRIERSSAGAKNAELIVSLEAGSIPRRIQSTQSFIDQVVVEPSGTRSVARIRLARSGLKLKEMILAGPPRIVLDVIAEQDQVTGDAIHSAASTTKLAATPPAARPSPTTKPIPTTAATPPPKAAPMTKLAPAPKPVATVAQADVPKSAPIPAPTPTSANTTPVAKPTTPSASPTPGTKLLASTQKPQTGASPAKSAPSSAATAAPNMPAATPATPPPASNGSAPSSDEWNDGGAVAQNDAAEAAGHGADGVAPSAAGHDAMPGATPDAAQPKPRPMMVKSSSGDEEGEGGGLMTWALAGLGVAVVGFGGLVIARRRRAAAGLDEDGDAGERSASPFDDAADEEAEESEEEAEESEESEEDEDAEEEEEEERPTRSESRNPFAALTGSAPSKPAAAAASPTRPSRVADKQEKKPSESLLFDDAEEKTMEGMEVISRSQVNESLGGPMPMMGGASEELTQMFREMQRRVAALEGRIDELVDARDRLERQVAAQTEELRVQRAAIARTQRAVRNLSTREEAGDDEPTEPALREPN